MFEAVSPFVRQAPSRRVPLSEPGGKEPISPFPFGPVLPRHRPPPVLIADDHVGAHRDRLQAELREIDAELRKFPEHSVLVSARAVCMGCLRRLEERSGTGRKLAAAGKVLAEASTQLAASQRAVDDLNKHLQDRKERRKALQAQIEKARAEVGVADLDGKLTSKQREQLASLESDARISQAAIVTLAPPVPI